MSDNHENFQDGLHTAQNPDSAGTQKTAETPYAYGSTYSAGSSQQNVPQTYTWSAQSGPYHTGGVPGGVMPPAPHKKRGAPFGVKLLSVVLCCVLVSAATLGTFVLLIQNGVIGIESKGDNALFTISRVVNSEPEESGSVSALSEQDIAEKLIPSVVCIQNYQVTQQYGFMQTDTENSDVSPAGEGSGIIFSEDGYIVTNAHVVDGATSLKAILSDGTTYEAELVGSDTLTDLAVLKIDATGLQAAEFGSSEDLRVADQVMAIGNPGGYQLNSSVTIGYVSALNRAITNSSTGYTMEYIQTDAAINPGNSGGALVNQYGQVVGINSAKISATGYEGLGFAIPAETAQPVISDLIEYGYVKDRAMLGISGQFIDSLTGRFYGLPQGEYVGALNSAEAQASGLQVGDVITAIDGTELTSETVLRSAINAKKPGETVELTVYRPSSNQTVTVTLTLSETTESATTAQAQDSAG
ncbi:MAG: S1C family serine protease [Acutalibacteraceae bacterium]